ncbi:MAG: hypothetical protein ACOYN5_15630 [Bacteroidales bacterium]
MKTKRLACLFLFITSIFLSKTSFSQEKVFIREYRYTAGESDSKITAREKAISQVKALLLEELGTYVESYVNLNIVETEKISESFFQQEIKTLSAGTTETIILEENWNGYEFYIKAQIKADPNEVIRKINETLSARRSSVMIDSLKLLLNASNQEIKLRSRDLDIVKAQLDNKNQEVLAKQSTLNTLNQQLETAKQKLSNYETQERQILTEIETIEKLIENATAKAINNIRLGMTPAEVKQVCGIPRSTEDCSGNLYYNYGAVWVIIENGIVTCVVDARDFGTCQSRSYYITFKARLILK